MKCKKIDIRYSKAREEFSANVYTLPGDYREDNPIAPNPSGFFSFPETMQTQHAFELLKQVMLQKLEQSIEELCNSRDKLKALTLEGSE